MRNRPTITIAAPQIVAHAKFAPGITYVRAKNISPLHAPTMSGHPTIKHRRTPHRGTRPIRPRTTDVRAKYFSPARARLMRNRPTIKHRRTPNRGTRQI